MRNKFENLMRSAIFAAGLALSSVACANGTIVVGGDITGTFNLGPDQAQGLEGNRIFYSRVLGDATRVAIGGETSNSFATGNLEHFYSLNLGAQVTALGGSITPEALSGIGLLALVMPNQAFAAEEVTAIGNFTRAGGRLLLLGEASEARVIHPGSGLPDGTVSNTILNDLLAGIGATIRLDNTSVGVNQLTSDIRSNPLTDGITSFGYGYVSSVSGGEALFATPANIFPGALTLPFFATETLAQSAVPEPATWALLMVGFGVTGAAMRRQQNSRACRRGSKILTLSCEQGALQNCPL